MTASAALTIVLNRFTRFQLANPLEEYESRIHTASSRSKQSRPARPPHERDLRTREQPALENSRVRIALAIRDGQPAPPVRRERLQLEFMSGGPQLRLERTHAIPRADVIRRFDEGNQPHVNLP